MKFAKAVTKYVRVAPQKARLAAGLIRGKSATQASLQLQFSKLKGGRLLKKTLDSAVANAEVCLETGKEDLQIHEVRVDGGPSMKRAKARNRGGRSPILKRTSHFTIIVSTRS